jgi:hypothetical protein
VEGYSVNAREGRALAMTAWHEHGPFTVLSVHYFLINILSKINKHGKICCSSIRI